MLHDTLLNGSQLEADLLSIPIPSPSSEKEACGAFLKHVFKY